MGDSILQLTIRRSVAAGETMGGENGRLHRHAVWIRVVQVTAIFAVLGAGLLYQDQVGDRTAGKGTVRPIEEYRFAPVRVHLLRAPDAPAVDTTLTRADIDRIFRKANGIWHAAGVHLWVESVVEEAPAVIDDPHAESIDIENALKALRPKKSLAEGMFHVYYLGHMTVNGIHLGRDAIFVQQAAMLREVEDGIDEPLPRVTSHEVGHALGLPHRQNRTNLMASGTTGTSLNDAEIATVRGTCEKTPWIVTASALLDAADVLVKQRKQAEARARFQAVAGLPGDSPMKARAAKSLAAIGGLTKSR